MPPLLQRQDVSQVHRAEREPLSARYGLSRTSGGERDPDETKEGPVRVCVRSLFDDRIRASLGANPGRSRTGRPNGRPNGRLALRQARRCFEWRFVVERPA
jgi:hypothetical protein